MKKDQVKIGKVYAVKVSGRIAPVRIVGESRFGGWDGVNLAPGGRAVRIKSAARFRYQTENVAGRWAPAGKKAAAVESADAKLAKVPDEDKQATSVRYFEVVDLEKSIVAMAERITRFYDDATPGKYKGFSDELGTLRANAFVLKRACDWLADRIEKDREAMRDGPTPAPAPAKV